MVDYVFRDGSRLTPYMLYQINRADADFYRAHGCHLLVTSGIRTNAEQTKIFLSKYRVQWLGSGPYGDVRYWQGRRYVRVVGGGTVAAPGKSNHEIQGSQAAMDLRDSGSGPGVATGGNVRANWLRANAHKYGLVPEGYGFGEPWHYAVLNIFNSVPGPGAGAGAGAGVAPAPKPVPTEPIEEIVDEEEDEMKPRQIHYVQPNGKIVRAEFVPGTSYFVPWGEGTASKIANALSTSHETGASVELPQKVWENFRAAAEAMLPKDRVRVEIVDAES